MRRFAVFVLLAYLLLVLTGCNLPPAPPPSEPSPPASSPSAPSPATTALPDIIEEIPQSTELITRSYAWTYGGEEWTWELQIPQALYSYYHGMPRIPSDKNWSVYITHPLDDTYINDLVDEIQRAAQEEGFSEYETVEFAATFVQSLPYAADSVTTPYDEYPRYPIETLVDEGGDCEDTSFLLASLLNSMGYGVILIVLPDHVAVGVLGGEGINGAYFEYNGGKYFYLETTNPGWEVGEMPKEYDGVTAHLYDMTPTPILTHDWRATGRGDIVELEVTVENLGSADANNIHVLAGFDAGGDMVWNAEESQPFQLLVNQRISITLTLQAPLGEHTRLLIQIIGDGYALDESYSEWFDT